MTKGITLITPTVYGREHYLAVATESVRLQTLPPTYHFIGVDIHRDGPSAVRTQLLRGVETEFVAFLDDDDYLYPHHLATLYEAARQHDSDLVYSWCDFAGPPLPQQYYNNHWDRQKLREHGIFPITVLARTELVQECGGFRDEDTYEDWELWNRMCDAYVDTVFTCVPEITWTYRTGHESRTTQAMAGER